MAPAPAQVLNPGTVPLVGTVVYEEHLVGSLGAYGNALAYLRTASHSAKVAHARLAQDVAEWHVATVRREQAVKVELADAATVALYRRALYELGVAEYTGQLATKGANLKAAQHQLVVVQYGEIVAGEATQGLDVAQTQLASAQVRVRVTTELVSLTWRRAQVAKRVVVLADAQLGRSRIALVEARQWVADPDLSPAQPNVALAALERPSVGASGAAGTSAPRSSTRLVAGPALPVATTAPTSLTVATAPTSSTATAPPTSSTVASRPTSVPALGGETGAAGTSGAAPVRAAITLAQLVRLGPAILGTSLLAPAQMKAWFISTGATANTTVPIGQLAADYVKQGDASGVRGDIAFAQAIVETGYFAFPTYGQDPKSYNNFAGIGACDSCKHGFDYPTALAGVAAQEHLLQQYALPYASPTNLAPFGVAGNSQTWMALSGTWASNINYGFEILSVYELMLTFVAQQDMAQYGLLSPTAGGLAGALVTTATTATTAATAAREELPRLPAKSAPTPSRSHQT